MKTKYWLISIITVFSICLLFTTPVMAQSPTPQPEGPNYQGDKVVVANTYRLQSGESLTGNLAVIGGTATIEKGATITDDHYYINKIRNIPTIDIIHLVQNSNNAFYHTWHTTGDDLSTIDKYTLKAVGQTLLTVIYEER